MTRITIAVWTITFLLAGNVAVQAGNASTKDLTETQKKVLTDDELERMVATGLNLHKLLCAEIVEIRPLKQAGVYEVICIAYRGGTATKTYMIEALKGVAFVP